MTLPVFALLLACNPWRIPEGAQVPPPGDITEPVGTLDQAITDPEIYLHPYDNRRALIGGSLGAAYILWLADARTGEVRRVCEDFDGDRVRPARMGWRNEVGFWDEIDGRVTVMKLTQQIVEGELETTWTLWGCQPDLLVSEVASFQLEAWPNISAAVPGGTVTWERDAAAPVDHPVRIDWSDGTRTPLSAVGQPLEVARRHDGEGFWVAVHDEAADTLAVHDVDAASGASVVALTVELEGEALESIVHLHPDALIFLTAAGLRAASAAAGGQVHELPSHLLAQLESVLLYPDGTGFVVHLMGISVDLTNGSVVDEGYAVRTGHHYTFSGDSAAWRIDVSENRDGRAGPVASFTVDVSHETDPIVLGFAGPIRGLAVGFEDGSCALVREHGLDPDVVGRPAARNPGDEGWFENDDVLLWTRCGSDQADVLVKALHVPRLGDVVGTLKHDVMAFHLNRARLDDAAEPQPLGMGWVVSRQGEPTGLYTDIRPGLDAQLMERRGTAIWVVRDHEVRFGDFGEQL